MIHDDNSGTAVCDDIAVAQGYAACMRGEAPWDNPYQLGTVCHFSWERGWDCANVAKCARRVA